MYSRPPWLRTPVFLGQQRWCSLLVRWLLIELLIRQTHPRHQRSHVVHQLVHQLLVPILNSSLRVAAVTARAESRLTLVGTIFLTDGLWETHGKSKMREAPCQAETADCQEQVFKQWPACMHTHTYTHTHTCNTRTFGGRGGGPSGSVALQHKCNQIVSEICHFTVYHLAQLLVTTVANGLVQTMQMNGRVTSDYATYYCFGKGLMTGCKQAVWQTASPEVTKPHKAHFQGMKQNSAEGQHDGTAALKDNAVVLVPSAHTCSTVHHIYTFI